MDLFDDSELEVKDEPLPVVEENPNSQSLVSNDTPKKDNGKVKTSESANIDDSSRKEKSEKRRSAVMARAAFWDKRIENEQASDADSNMEYPELPAETFKR